MKDVIARALGAGMTIVLAAISGCGSVRIHDDARDKQGQAVKASWANADVNGLLSADRDNLSKILQSKLDSNAQLYAAYRDDQLRALLGRPTIRDGLLILEINELAELVRPADAVKQKPADPAEF